MKARSDARRVALCEPVIGDLEASHLLKCLRSGFVSSSGPLIAQFESVFAGFVGTRHAVATASGTAAIHVSMRALNIGKHSTVAVPDLTFVASMTPALQEGARVALLDVDPGTWTMDAGMLDKVCRRMERSGGVDAVVPVHLYGGVCDMPRIMAVARKHGLCVIEDATEALGSRIGSKHVGIFGDVGCFSFNGNKMVTTGGGGMVVTNSAVLARRVRYLVNQARLRTDCYLHGEPGFNYRLTNLAASLGLAQMKRLPWLIRRKQEIERRYRRGLAGISGLRLPENREDTQPVWWMFSIVAETPRLANRIRSFLTRNGVECRPFFLPLHRQPYMRTRVWVESKNNVVPATSADSDSLAARGINLPSSPTLTSHDQERVIELVRKAVELFRSR